MKKYLVYIALLFVASSCVTAPNEALQEMDDEAVAVINEVALSLSAKPDGLVSSLYDATGSLSPSGMDAGESSFKVSVDMPGQKPGPPNRGEDKNVQITVDYRTGVHTLTFDRELTDTAVTKTLSAVYKYVYEDNNGRHLFFPRRNQDRIGNISFVGFKNGIVQGPKHRTGFQRTDSLSFTGFGRDKGAIQVRGNTYSQGYFNYNAVENTLVRTYKAEYQFEDLQINRPSVENRNLTTALSGSITFKTTSMRTNGADTLKTKFEGKVEFNGDGTALIRLRGYSEPYLINLNEGNFYEPEHRGR
ncbi:hypothetical protein EP331_12370 [bacterium]|nr:MAG: hypothetical protein EP331_12370 [bacterium]